MKLIACVVLLFIAIATHVKGEWELIGRGLNKPVSRIQPLWWFAISIASLMLCVGTCNAQKLLWRVEIHGLDTVAVGPAGDIDSAFVRWSARGKDLRDCKWDLYMRDKELISLYTERAKCIELNAKAEENAAELRDQRDKQRERAEKAERKARRRNPITYLLIGAVGGFILNNSIR